MSFYPAKAARLVIESPRCNRTHCPRQHRPASPQKQYAMLGPKFAHWQCVKLWLADDLIVRLSRARWHACGRLIGASTPPEIERPRRVGEDGAIVTAWQTVEGHFPGLAMRSSAVWQRR